MKVAVVGAGLAGLATASFLRQQGHDVTVFERDAELKGRGLGIALQPVGLAVLKKLGLLDKVVASGTRIDRMGIDQITKSGKARTLSDLRYEDLEPGLFAVGIHRVTLYNILLENARTLGVNLVAGCKIQDAVLKGAQRQLLDSDNNDRGSFDLVVDSSGYRSPLRQKYATITRHADYPEAAICGIVEDKHGFSDSSLKKTTYRYQGDYALTLIPVGKDPATGKDHTAFFWAKLKAKNDHFDLAAWKKEVLDVFPAMQTYLDQVTSQDQLVFAHYSDVALKVHHADKLAFTGDSAHSTSPFLGQNAAMGFVDALVLSTVLQNEPDVKKALETYSAERANHVQFQQDNSRKLTNVFRSAALPVKFYREHLMSVLLRLPGQRKTMMTLVARAEKSIKKSPLRKKYGI